jgi:NADPH-dependent curcumin reductase CurA
LSSNHPTDLKQLHLPGSNRRVLLIERPHGVPQPAHFRIEEDARPHPAPGEFLVRNLYLSVDAAQRGWATDANNYSQAVPLGATMRALTVGVVVESRASEVTEGTWLYGWFGWQDYCVATPAAILQPVDPKRAPPSTYVGILGMNGLTAYLALMDIGQPRAGETVLVSAAAGGVGTVVGQIAKLLGCNVIGLVGSDDKARTCRERFGYAEALNHRRADLAEALRVACPKGIDVYFDNVGGTLLDLSLRNMAARGRVIQCGTVSHTSWSPTPTGLRNEREILVRRLRWEGFIIFDHVHRFPAATAQLLAWLDEGALTYEEDVSQGIESAPRALAELYAGDNIGKKLIYIG